MILITGCARSGTTLTAAVLQASGLNLGKVNQLNECTAIRDGLVKPYLKSIGADPLGQDPLPETCEPVEGWRERVREKTDAEGYKGAKMCLMWPVWHAAFPEAKWVIVRKVREKIIDSCLRTSFMKRRVDRKEWGEWVDHHLDRFAAIRANCDAIEVWPECESFRPVVDFCGLEWNEDAVAEVLSQRHG